MLTDQEKTRVRFYLGHGSLFRYLNPRLEGLWGALDDNAEAIIRQILGQLSTVDQKLYGDGTQPSDAMNQAGVKSLEEIALSGQMISDLRRIGRGLVSRLSALVGVPIGADVYSENGWPGDMYSAMGGIGGLGGGGGGMIPLG